MAGYNLYDIYILREKLVRSPATILEGEWRGWEITTTQMIKLFIQFSHCVLLVKRERRGNYAYGQFCLFSSPPKDVLAFIAIRGKEKLMNGGKCPEKEKKLYGRDDLKDELEGPYVPR